ncbi:85/88 kDa calcium-independent phospholipase A2 [Ixodes scapularis]
MYKGRGKRSPWCAGRFPVVAAAESQEEESGELLSAGFKITAGAKWPIKERHVDLLCAGVRYGNRPKGGEEEATHSEQLVWRAARASGAAPTYFRPFGRFLDGGLISNNPTLDAMTEICEYNEALKATGQEEKMQPLEVVVSLGTGKIPVVPVTVIDMLHMGTGILGAAKMAFGAKALGQLIIDQATQANGRLVDRAQAWCRTIGVPYFRLNAPISEDVCLNETDNRLLVRVLWETLVYMRGRRAELDELAQLVRP